MHHRLEAHLFLSALDLRPCVPHLPALAVFYLLSVISSGAYTWDIPLKVSSCVPSESQLFLLILRSSRRVCGAVLAACGFDASHMWAICFLHVWSFMNGAQLWLEYKEMLSFTSIYILVLLMCLIPWTSFMFYPQQSSFSFCLFSWRYNLPALVFFY